MFSALDKAIFDMKGLTINEAVNQIEQFKNGFPNLEIVRPATVKEGIKKLSDQKVSELVEIFEKEGTKYNVMKFVPASGAASRMFKNLFEIINTYNGTEQDYLKLIKDRGINSVYYVCQNIHNFAFFPDLKQALEKANVRIEDLCKTKDFALLFRFLLMEDGLNYGNLPKGLLKFHRTTNGAKTPTEEHLMEGVQYSNNHGIVKIQFTVSPQHLDLFKALLIKVQSYYEKKYSVNFDISFSIQKASTDTIAVTADNEVFRDANGEPVFRPGGHGALIENLNELDADIIFIKNIDNVVQDRLKKDTYTYKKALGGLLIRLQEKIFQYLQQLDKGVSAGLLEEMEEFVAKKLFVDFPESYFKLKKADREEWIYNKLNRPIRICGMVLNEGEPGGGPYWVRHHDGSCQLQIVEASQISTKYKPLMQKATHFNPVDLVCSVRDYKGEKFDLKKYIDNNTGFISSKSVNGTEVKALELPGLWNGAMSDWTTVFVEVPISTFNPVKTINDLLRREHLFENDLLNSNPLIMDILS